MNVLYISDVYVSALGLDTKPLSEIGRASDLLGKLRNVDRRELEYQTAMFIRLCNRDASGKDGVEHIGLNDKNNTISIEPNILEKFIDKLGARMGFLHKPNRKLTVTTTSDGTVLVMEKENREPEFTLMETMLCAYGEINGTAKMLESPAW